MYKIKPILVVIGLAITLPLLYQNCGRFNNSSLNQDHLQISMEQKDIVDGISLEHEELNSTENFLDPNDVQAAKGAGISHQKIGSPKVFLAPSKIKTDSITTMIINVDSVISQNRTYYYSEINFIDIGMELTPAAKWNMEQMEKNRQPNDGGG